MSTPVPLLPARNTGEAEAWLRNVARGIRRDWWLILAILLTVVAMAMIFTRRQEPVYESAATLLFQQKDRQVSLMNELDPRQMGAGGGAIETDMAVLRSRLLAQVVADSLALNVYLQEPAVPRQEVFQSLDVSEQTRAGTYEMVRDPSGTYRLERVGRGANVPVLTGIVPGRSVTVGGLSFALSPALAASQPARIRFSVGTLRDAADGLRGLLTVARLDPRADIVTLQYRSAEPDLAAAVPNVMADAFIRYKQRTSRTESGSTVDFLREQVASYQRDLQAAESRLQQFREQTRIVSLEDEASEQVNRLADLQAKRDQVNTEATSLRRLLSEAEAGRRGAAGEVSYRRLASFPAFFSNKAVQDILSSLMELENKRGELLVRRTSENVDVQGLDQRISELENQLYQMARSYLASLESQRVSMDAELAEFGKQLQTIPAREIQFARLARDRELLANMYTLLQTRLKEAEIRNVAQVGDVQVLDPATVPTAPISPRPVYNLVIALVLGMVLAGGTVLVRNGMDTRVWTRDQALAVAGGLPLLAAIPRIQGPSENGLQNGGSVVARLNPAKLFPLPQDRSASVDSLVTWRDPRSVVSEAFRGLRTSVTLAGDRSPVRMVMVTSPMSGDGKSTSSANLAITYAQQGLRTLLVDADLRNGSLRQLLGAPDAPGLTEVLNGAATLHEAVREIRVGDGGPALAFLGAGARPHNPAELVGSREMRALLTALREEYEIVVLDVPPVALVTDALVMGKEVDAALLVARLGFTDREALEDAVRQLRRIQVPFEGLVLNDAPLPSHYYSYTV